MVPALMTLLLGLAAPFALRRCGGGGTRPTLMVAGHVAGLTLTWIGVLGVAAAMIAPGTGLWELCRLIVIRPLSALGPMATSGLAMLAVLVPGRAAVHCTRVVRDGRRLRRRLSGSGTRGDVRGVSLGTVACTVGVVRAWVVVDPERLARLSTEHQRAVLAHEHGHVAGMHGLVDLVTRSLAAGLAPWPGARVAVGEVRRHLEAAADDVAARQSGACTVADAIVAVACQPTPAIGTLGAVGWTLWRVERLLEASATRPRTMVLAVGVLTVTALVVGQAMVHTLHGLSGAHPVVLAAVCCMA